MHVSGSSSSIYVQFGEIVDIDPTEFQELLVKFWDKQPPGVYVGSKGNHKPRRIRAQNVIRVNKDII